MGFSASNSPRFPEPLPTSLGCVWFPGSASKLWGGWGQKHHHFHLRFFNPSILVSSRCMWLVWWFGTSLAPGILHLSHVEPVSGLLPPISMLSSALPQWLLSSLMLLRRLPIPTSVCCFFPPLQRINKSNGDVHHLNTAELFRGRKQQITFNKWHVWDVHDLLPLYVCRDFTLVCSILGNCLRRGWGIASPSMGVCRTDLLILKCIFDILSLVLGILLACLKVTWFYEIVGYWW